MKLHYLFLALSACCLTISCGNSSKNQQTYLQLIIPQYFISNKSVIWSLSLIVHSKG